MLAGGVAGPRTEFRAQALEGGEQLPALVQLSATGDFADYAQAFYGRRWVEHRDVERATQGVFFWCKERLH